jgi:sarcosine oxidase subunit beta
MNKIEQKADIVIIGGGVNGCSLAYQLAKKGKKVVLVEKSYLCSGATGRCGAGIRQQWSTKENAELAIKSVKIFEGLEKELGQDIGLRQGGYLIVVHDKKDMVQSQKNVEMQKGLGLDVSILTPDEIVKIVPILDINGMNAIGATFCPTDGHVDPFKTTHAYAKAAQDNGAKLYKFTNVTNIKTKNKRIDCVITDKGEIKTNFLINAAGAWSKKIAEIVGVKLPNMPFRKEILVTERIKPIFKAMVISFKDGIYFSQQDEGQILGGIPISAEKSGYLIVPTFDFLHHMSKTLTRYAPNLKQVNVIRQWTGYYDVTPDARPIIGVTDNIKGFIQCNGFSGHGFMLSPMVTKLLTEYIVEGKSPDILESLNLRRFKGKKIVKEVSVVG